MVSMPSKNTWMRRQQCPCGDWKCFLTYEGNSEETSLTSQLVKSESGSSEAIVAPYVGMVFNSDEGAFEYYGNFARKNGFSIRKERSRLSPQLGVYKRDIVCYRSGFAPAKKRVAGENHRDRKSVRCGCDAKMHLSKEVIDGVSQWFVVQFSNVHNHELLEDDQVCLLPAYRKIQEADQERILLLSKAGFPIHRIVKVLELEKGTQGGQLPFMERDVRNFVQNRKKVLQEKDALLTEKRENDTMDLLEVCRAAKDGDAYFVYDVTLDANDKVENIAWSNRDSINAYDMYGDVVYFDTTHHSTTYSLLFGAWLGIDNHGKIVILGCALLQDETSRSFTWALQTFVHFMKGRCPLTIITDLDPALRDAIRSELPNTKHVVPTWNIMPKLSSWFHLLLGPNYGEFKSQFDLLYHLERTEDFDFRWNELVSRFGLHFDKHVALLFSLRSLWVLSYTKGCFLAQMTTIAYSKSLNEFLKGIFGAKPCLRTLFEQVGISSNSNKHAHEDSQFRRIRTSLPMEKHAKNILTHFAFSALQHELVLAMQYATSEMPDGSYLVRHFKNMYGECLVTWIPENEQIQCSCKGFESSGILCRHTLRVLIVKNYFQLPERYLLSRWLRDSSPDSFDDQSNGKGSDEWFLQVDSLTGTLFAESSFTKERSDYVRRELEKELTRLISEVRDMPSTVDDS